MSGNIFTFRQNIFRSLPADDIDVIQFQDSDLDESIVDDFLLTAEGSVGIAAAFGRKCTLSAIAVASGVVVLHIQLTSNRRSRNGRAILSNKILCNPDVSKLGFDMHRLSTSLHLDHGLHIVHAIDLQSVLPSSTPRWALGTIMGVLGGETILHKQNVVEVFMENAQISSSAHNVAHRAWASGRVRHKNMARVLPINTSTMDKKVMHESGA